MMKIKVKKEMRLDELIKWAWNNPELVRGKNFYPQGKSNETYVYFHLYDGRKCLINDFISTDDTFIVEVEEEITEETKFDRLFEVFEVSEGEYNPTSNRNTSINESLNDDRCFPIKAFYILNDDLTMTLIWKDGRLVE
ncbi:phage protein [Staphylococcus aureus]|nr:phage protein [Staphylococcus aureus]GBY18580.1 phage protein [Staphylococcus aureus]GBZ36317.1 phage protein [Staphylococcus aureus]